MKFTLNPAFSQANGAMDEMMFRTVRGKVIAFRKPDLSKVVYSEKQIAVRERFKEAADYGKGVMNDEDVRQMYEVVAQERGMPIFAVMVADYFNAPVITKVNTDAYTGQANQVIQVTARDDFGVARVHVKISDLSGTIIESGDAVNTSAARVPGHIPRSTQWTAPSLSRWWLRIARAARQSQPSK